MDYQTTIQAITRRAQDDPQVIGVILYGSYLQAGDFHDIDIALCLDPGMRPRDMARKRLEYLQDLDEIFDIQIFNRLPLVVQHEILKGKVLKETPMLYEVAYRTIREFEDFEKYLIEYRESVFNANR